MDPEPTLPLLTEIEEEEDVPLPNPTVVTPPLLSVEEDEEEEEEEAPSSASRVYEEVIEGVMQAGAVYGMERWGKQ